MFVMRKKGFFELVPLKQLSNYFASNPCQPLAQIIWGMEWHWWN